MPMDPSILSLEECEIEKVKPGELIHIKARYTGKVRCIYCDGVRLHKKDSFERKLKHISIGNKNSILHMATHKYHCLSCKRYFNIRLPGILKYKRSTEAFRYEVSRRHLRGVSQSDLAKDFGIGSATVERWCKDYLKRQEAEKTRYPCPKILGIDEHFFTRKKGYATTFCDLKNRKIYDVVLGRSEKSLETYFSHLQGKTEVKVVVMDLAETYRNISKQHFPNALIVADRFHVIRLINHHFMKLWQLLDPIGRKNRGLISLMRRHSFNLKQQQRENLDKYLNANLPLKIIYQFKHRLSVLMLNKQANQRYCKRHLIPEFFGLLEQLKNSPFEPMQSLAKTLNSWSAEIARMWRFTRSNSITEGFHNKMELISRRAYGFKNFENYRLRVKALCA